MKPSFYDFFAGAGLATLGLAPSWRCLWANDVDLRKAAVYKANFADSHFVLGDLARISAAEMPVPADMAWASFPCQDLSLAGWRGGLAAPRSGSFWIFQRLMNALSENRPPLIVLENVTGLLYGNSFAGLCEAIASLDMQLGALLMDARWFLPQSRPRIFLVAMDARCDASFFTSETPSSAWTSAALLRAYEGLSHPVKKMWRWWRLPAPTRKPRRLASILEREGVNIPWHTADETEALLAMMHPRHRNKIQRAVDSGGAHTGFLYKRTRGGIQRAEARFDGLAGCLRTPAGGSSRQTVVQIDRGVLRTRLLSAREAARLMGAPDSFILPPRYQDAYRAMGDAVAVPVVSWLSEWLLLPLARIARGAGTVKRQSQWPTRSTLAPAVGSCRASCPVERAPSLP